MKHQGSFWLKAIALTSSLVLLMMGALPAQAGFFYSSPKPSTEQQVPFCPPAEGLLSPWQRLMPVGNHFCYYDNGSAEIYAGGESGSGRIVMVNRFPVDGKAYLKGVSFHPSPLAAGQTVDLVVYEDTVGRAELPDFAMEVYRMSVVLEDMGDDGFQRVAIDELELNADGGGGAFFVGLDNTDEWAHLSLGVDMDGAQADSSYVYIESDGFTPFSDHSIIHGNAMIRAWVRF